MEKEPKQEKVDPEPSLHVQSPFVSVRNSDPNDSFQVDRPYWRFWNQIPVLMIFQAVNLSMDLHPLALDDVSDKESEQFRTAEREHRLRLMVASSWVEAGTIECLPEDSPEIETVRRRVSAHAFVECARKFGWTIPPSYLPPPPALPTAGFWPWGAHETDALRALAAAGRQWWTNYDSKAPGNAPTNEQVTDWLKKEFPALSNRAAASIATILRPDDLPTGPRPPASGAWPEKK